MQHAAIIACGARTPIGLRAMAASAAARAGIQRIREHPYMVDRAGDPYCVGMDATLEVIGRLERTVTLARSAIAEALDNFGGNIPEAAIYISVGEFPGGEGESSAREIASRLTADLAHRGRFYVTAIPRGNAGGFEALQAAVNQIASGHQHCCIVAGADSFVDADRLDLLDAQARLLCTRHRWGFPPGEAGAAVIIASQRGAADHSILGNVLSIATGYEPNHFFAEEPCTGVGLGNVLTEALNDSGTAAIGNALCDLDGERFRDREYAWATQRIPSTISFEPSRYYSLSESCGSVGGAFAILAAVFAICWARRGRGSETDVLLWSGSDHGQRGAAVLRMGSAQLKERF